MILMLVKVLAVLLCIGFVAFLCLLVNYCRFSVTQDQMDEKEFREFERHMLRKGLK